MKLYGQQYVFGCCSLTTQDPDDGWRALKTIRANGNLHSELFLPAQPGYACGPRERDEDIGGALSLPKLFKTYLRLGAKVISEPAIDRRFGTVDFLVLQDGHEVSLSQLNVMQ
jgi:putative hemolysin